MLSFFGCSIKAYSGSLGRFWSTLTIIGLSLILFRISLKVDSILDKSSFSISLSFGVSTF